MDAASEKMWIMVVFAILIVFIVILTQFETISNAVSGSGGQGGDIWDLLKIVVGGFK